MGRLTRTALLEREARQGRNIRRKPTSVRTIMILLMQGRNQGKGNEGS